MSSPRSFDLIEKVEKKVTLIYPHLIITQMEESMGHFQLVPYCMFSEETTFNKRMILSSNNKLNQGLIDVYNKVIGPIDIGAGDHPHLETIH